MNSNQKNETFARELAQIRAQLVQIKFLLAGILALAIGVLVGPGPVFTLMGFGVIVLGTVYVGLWVFEGIVNRRIDHDWSDARLASMAEDAEKNRQEDSGEQA